VIVGVRSRSFPETTAWLLTANTIFYSLRLEVAVMLKFNIVKNVHFKTQAKFHFVILIWVGTAVVGRGS
jgi:hypothetical protein